MKDWLLFVLLTCAFCCRLTLTGCWNPAASSPTATWPPGASCSRPNSTTLKRCSRFVPFTTNPTEPIKTILHVQACKSHFQTWKRMNMNMNLLFTYEAVDTGQTKENELFEVDLFSLSCNMCFDRTVHNVPVFICEPHGTQCTCWLIKLWAASDRSTVCQWFPGDSGASSAPGWIQEGED